MPNRNADHDHRLNKLEVLTTLQITALAVAFQLHVQDLKDIRSSSEVGKNSAEEHKAWKVQKKGTIISHVNTTQ